MQNMTAAKTIKHMSQCFAIFGNSDTVVTDIGTKFTSDGFQKF